MSTPRRPWMDAPCTCPHQRLHGDHEIGCSRAAAFRRAEAAEGLRHNLARVEATADTLAAERRAAVERIRMALPIGYTEITRAALDRILDEETVPSPETPDPTKWQWYGDWSEGVRHGAGEGWLHIHPDGTRWVHLEKVCLFSEVTC